MTNERNKRSQRPASTPSPAPLPPPEVGEIHEVRIDPRGVGGLYHADFRTKDGETGCAYVRPAHAGKPLVPGERLLYVHPEGPEGVRPVREVYRHPSGPARVNSDAYRAGYDAIFGKREIGNA